MTTHSHGTGRTRRRVFFLSIVVALSTIANVEQRSVPAESRPMSFNNRLLFNRMAVNPRESLEVMLAAELGQVPAVVGLVERLQGRVAYVDADVGYVRAEVARSRFSELIADSRIVGYQISSLSRMLWYEDAPAERRETMRRGYEVLGLDPLNLTDHAREVPSHLQVLSVEEARRPGYTAAEDVGLDQWFAEHPTYDGRGITIASMEGPVLDFGHPAFRHAKTLDGRDTPKFAGIIASLSTIHDNDATVNMDRVIHPTTTWHRVEQRTYLMPRPGTFRFGVFSIPAGGNVSHNFALLLDEASGDVWVDANGDASFRDERPMRDFNERFETRQLTLSSPKLQLDFAITVAPSAPAVLVHIGRSIHATMTASVAAGSRTSESVAYGVAPAARLMITSRWSAKNAYEIVESYLETARRPDVDILYDARLFELVPDTGSDFLSVVFSRIVAVRGKPIFNSAGNDPPLVSSVTDFSDEVFSVGGSIGPATFASLFGGGLPAMTVLPFSAAGPVVDGSLKPDFLAPMFRVAAEPRSLARKLDRGLPGNRPTWFLPHGYMLSCCTSASSPYAAGVAALLLSAAKQQGIKYSPYTLGQALRRSATLLPDVPLHRQGNGVLNVAAAWAYLKATPEVVRIRARAHVRHVLSPYFPRPGDGFGLFEKEGWVKGQRGIRTIRLVRESGPAAPARYALTWTGANGTFASAESTELPLDREIEVPIRIHVRESGIHSAFLNVHHPATNAIITRIAATIVAAEPLGRNGRRTVTFNGRVGPLDSREYAISIPAATGAVRLDATVHEGRIAISILSPDGRDPTRYAHLFPQVQPPVNPGRYTQILANPTAGTWTLGVRGTNALMSSGGGAYTLSATVFSGTIAAELKTSAQLQYRVESTGAPLSRPALEISNGTLRIRSALHTATGEPVLEEVHVPEDAGTLVVKATAAVDSSPIEIHLYKCVTGQCFAYDHTLPAQSEQMIRVKRPEAGRWVAAVNAAPALVGTGGFTIQTLVTGPSERRVLAAGVQRWTGTIGHPTAMRASDGSSHAMLVELVDASLEEDERTQSLANSRDLAQLQNRPVAIATAVVRSGLVPSSSQLP